MIKFLNSTEKFIFFLEEAFNVKDDRCFKFIKLCIFLNGKEGFATNKDLEAIWKVEASTVYTILDYFVDIGLISITKKDKNSKLPIKFQRYISVSPQVISLLEAFYKNSQN